MLNYNELRAALDEAKDKANREIAAIIVQADKPLTAREIAMALGATKDGITDISSQSVSNLIAHSQVRCYARNLGYEIRKEKVEEAKQYVNPENPADVIWVTRHHNVYTSCKRR